MKKLPPYQQSYFDNWNDTSVDGRVKKITHKRATKYFNDIEFYRLLGADHISEPIEKILNECLKQVQLESEE